MVDTTYMPDAGLSLSLIYGKLFIQQTSLMGENRTKNGAIFTKSLPWAGTFSAVLLHFLQYFMINVKF